MSKNYKTFNAIHVVGAIGVPMKVGVPLSHLDPALSGFSYHVGYIWGLVIWHRNRGKPYVTAYDMRVSLSRNVFCNLYNGRSPEALVTGRLSCLILV